MLRRYFLNLAAAMLVAPPALAHGPMPDGHDHAEASAGEIGLVEVPVTDAEGRQRQFVQDLVAGKIVVIDAIFTDCTTVCPLTSSLLATARDEIAPVSKDVRFISVSLDPVRDTPERLRTYAATFGPSESWSLVTGERSDIVRLLKALGSFSADPAAHLPTVLVGDPDRGVWSRLFGLPDPDRVVELVRKLVEERQQREAHHAH